MLDDLVREHRERTPASAEAHERGSQVLPAGVYTTPRGMINLSTALTPADLVRVASAYATAFQRLTS